MINSIDRRLKRLRRTHKEAPRQQYYYNERGPRMRREQEAWQIYIKQLVDRRKRSLLFEIGRDQECVRQLMQGLAEHYANAALTGRLDVWERAVNANIGLILADKDQFALAKRSDFP